MAGEDPGQQPAQQTRKVIRSPHTSSLPAQNTHPHTLTSPAPPPLPQPTHSLHKQRASQAQAE